MQTDNDAHYVHNTVVYDTAGGTVNTQNKISRKGKPNRHEIVYTHRGVRCNRKIQHYVQVSENAHSSIQHICREYEKSNTPIL